MRAGTLRETVTIQEKRLTAVAGYNDSEAWHDIACVPARVEPIAGNEKLANAGMVSEAEYLVTMRYRELSDENRLYWLGSVLDVISVTPDERRTSLRVQVKKHG